KMGINIKVVTGDNEQVTEKICSEVGLPFKKHLLGKEISLLSDSELARVVESVQIFARCTPSQKSRIIKALQANNKVVGFLGDGINDSPALEAADVGISVDNGADIAKESADIILTHKSLEELKDGVFEGRKTFVNTTKYIKMGISSNFGNMFSLAIAAIFLPFLPMLPTQILLNNLLYDFAQITLPTDKVDEQDISKPRHWDMKFIKKFMFFFGPISSIYDLTTYFFLYYVLHVNAAMFQTGWFMESLATQTLVIFTIRTQGLPFIQSKPSKSLFVSVLLLVAIGWAIPYTYLGRLFGFETPPLSMALMLGGIVVAYLLTVEVAKHFFYSRLRRKMTSETKLAVA
ncbi:MAG: HAD-IC family P-type ATPase, partial [Candidatus Saccharibacteria bacterium]